MATDDALVTAHFELVSTCFAPGSKPPRLHLPVQPTACNPTPGPTKRRTWSLADPTQGDGIVRRALNDGCPPHRAEKLLLGVAEVNTSQ
jgi:hypothetical protein